MNFFDIYHNIMKEYGERPWSPPDPLSWPKEWSLVYRKWYERYQTFVLPEPTVELSLKGSFFLRSSSHDFKDFVSMQDISSLLYFGFAENRHREKREKRFYPSAGGKYPLEAYLIVKNKSENLPAGVYHYDPVDHVLQILPSDEKFSDFSKLTGQENLHNAGAAILITGVMSRVIPKYGERSYKYALIEAGAAMQSMCLVAASEKITVTPVSLLHDMYVERLLHIDGTNEKYLHALFFG